jgi:hypothetical protein
MRATTSRARLGKASFGQFAGHTRHLLFAAGLVVLCLATPQLFALDQAKLPTGADYAAAQAAPYNATGAGISIGIIEVGPRPRPNNNLGARLLGQWGFNSKTPGQAPDDNSAAAFPSDSSGRHMALVADTAAGADATYPGVAPGANVYTAAALGNYGSDDPSAAANDALFDNYRAAVDWMYRPQAAGPAWQQHPTIALFNNSWGAAVENDDNGNNRFARFVDYFANTRDALFVGASGNDATTAGERINWPWDAYNGITVGALDQDGDGGYRSRRPTSQYWLNGDNGTAPDIRGKPDIVAPGASISDNQTDFDSTVPPTPVPRNQSGTSFATPMVTGTAALLMQRGLNLPGPANRNHLALKSIILNSARKKGILGVNAANDTVMDNAATSAQASDENYLDNTGKALRPGGTPGGAPTNPTANWTPAKWAFGSGFFFVQRPLDDELGTGVLDTQRAIVQMDGGEQREKTFNPNGVGPIGWNRDAIPFGPSEHIYPLNFAIAAGTFITTTLTWDRIVSEVNSATGTAGTVDAGDTYNITGLPNLDLRVDYKGNPLAASISLVDNVEHLHFPVWLAGNPNDYDIRVDYTSQNGTNAGLVDYGLAWWTTAVPEPSTLVMISLAAVGVFARRYRHATR